MNTSASLRTLGNVTIWLRHLKTQRPIKAVGDEWWQGRSTPLASTSATSADAETAG